MHKESEIILRLSKPNYLETRVEDRLLDHGRKRLYKLEEYREKQRESTDPRNFVSTPVNPKLFKKVAYECRQLTE